MDNAILGPRLAFALFGDVQEVRISVEDLQDRVNTEIRNRLMTLVHADNDALFTSTQANDLLLADVFPEGDDYPVTRREIILEGMMLDGPMGNVIRSYTVNLQGLVSREA